MDENSIALDAINKEAVDLVCSLLQNDTCLGLFFDSYVECLVLY